MPTKGVTFILPAADIDEFEIRYALIQISKK